MTLPRASWVEKAHSEGKSAGRAAEAEGTAVEEFEFELGDAVGGRLDCS